MSANSQSRKYQLTLNNPLERGLTHEEIKRRFGELRSVEYYCLSDEVGIDTQTHHTHVYLVSKGPLRFSTLKRRFPEAHIEAAHGTSQQNRDYVAKSGKWADDPKADTAIPGTFEEWGELPEEPGQGARKDIAQVYYMIAAGMTNAQIMEANPDFAAQISRMDKIRQDIFEDRYRNDWRNLDVTYIWGPTGTGKTRFVMDTYGYGDVYRVTDYAHPFDRYAGEDVLLLDEFRSSLMIGDMLDYLDGYPLNLPARYANRVACYTKVYIITNIKLSEQYPNVQLSEDATWRAFLRRIHHVIEFQSDGTQKDHGNATDYIFPSEADWVKQAQEAYEQDMLPL